MTILSGLQRRFEHSPGAMRLAAGSLDAWMGLMEKLPNKQVGIKNEINALRSLVQVASKLMKQAMELGYLPPQELCELKNALGDIPVTKQSLFNMMEDIRPGSKLGNYLYKELKDVPALIRSFTIGDKAGSTIGQLGIASLVSPLNEAQIEREIIAPFQEGYINSIKPIRPQAVKARKLPLAQRLKRATAIALANIPTADDFRLKTPVSAK